MIGFVAAITASLAVIILVVISSLIGFVQSIMPSTGLVKIDDLTYRYNLKASYVNHEILKDLVLTVDSMSFHSHVKSYQAGCTYGFNTNEYEMKRIATFNYIAVNQFFSGLYPIENIKLETQPDKMNNCFIDIHLLPEALLQNGEPQSNQPSTTRPSTTLNDDADAQGVDATTKEESHG